MFYESLVFTLYPAECFLICDRSYWNNFKYLHNFWTQRQID